MGQKFDQKVIGITVILFVFVAVICVISGVKAKAYQNSLKAEANQVYKKEVSADQARSAEEKRIESLDFYQKLKEGDPVSILVLGDSVAASTGSTNNQTWISLLEQKLSGRYHSTFSTDNIVQGGTTIIRSWTEYNLQQPSNPYDCVFICDGVNDQFILHPKEFHMFYENLIDRLIKSNPKVVIFPILESAIKTDNAFTIDIKDLAKYYGLSVIDTRLAFSQSVKDSNSLTIDGVHPNDAGYNLYVNEMFDTIVNNMKNSVKVDNPKQGTFYSDSPKLNRFEFIKEPSSKKGFVSDGGVYSSQNAGDSISFQTTGDLAYIYYDSDTAGSSFDVYLNNIFVADVKTKESYKMNLSYLLPNAEPGTIKLVVHSLSTGGKVTIRGVVTD